MKITAFIALGLLCTATPATSQVPLDLPIAELLSLSRQPHLNQESFHHALASTLPGLEVGSFSADAPHFDPFVWSLHGSFGPNGARDVPGAIFSCARFGVSTHEYFRESRLSIPEVFALARQVLPLHDDEDVWPDGAVARLHCTFVWDDERIVAILPEEDAHVALSAMFGAVVPVIPAAGLEGYRLDATRGPENSVIHVEGATIILTQGHQSVQFRSFLMGGGS